MVNCVYSNLIDIEYVRSMSFGSNDASSYHKNGIESEVVGSRHCVLVIKNNNKVNVM